MLNLQVGDAVTIDGRACIATRAGVAGHAVYGPYEHREPGRYFVRFAMHASEHDPVPDDSLCAVLDVTSNGGNEQHASKRIFASDLRSGSASFVVPFALNKDSRLEYRVWVSGNISLLIEDHQRVVSLTGSNDDMDALLAQHSFPVTEGENLPFFVENRDFFRSLYDRGFGVRISGGDIVLTINGLSFYANCRDDMNFIGELFFENAYNFKSDRPICVIDIGMNIGLASLLFAKKNEVREVHSFEPFRSTYERALANLGLNGAVSGKIHAHNFGLADKDWEGQILVPQTSDSGAMSTIGTGEGIPVNIAVRDAATVLRPIVEDARARGLDVMVKVDCEGSEFAIFETLIANDLLRQLSGFMVEWHAMFDGKTQETLIKPLREAGFVVFDRSPPTGNGFFYAARLA